MCHSIWLEQMDAWIIPVSEELIAFYRSFVIVYTERGQWQAFLRQEKSACLAEVSVMDRLYGKLTEHAQTVCTSFFSAHVRAWERD